MLEKRSINGVDPAYSVEVGHGRQEHGGVLIVVGLVGALQRTALVRCTLVRDVAGEARTQAPVCSEGLVNMVIALDILLVPVVVPCANVIFAVAFSGPNSIWFESGHEL